jgi:hypothetical protein
LVALGDPERIMALSLSHARPQAFAQHIRRLCWFALVAAVVITARAVQPAIEPAPQITSVAVAVFLGAIWTIAAHVRDYVRREQARRIMDGARAAAQVVSTLKQDLGCAGDEVAAASISGPPVGR